MQGANYLGDVLTQATRAAPPAAPMRAVSEIAEAAPITPKPLPPEPVRSDIGFYSQLEAATNPLQDKGTGDQFLSQLQKSAGVKPDEIKYTGLDEFLKGKKAVTKAEIQGYLASNKVDVQEVRLGDYHSGKKVFLKHDQDQASCWYKYGIVFAGYATFKLLRICVVWGCASGKRRSRSIGRNKISWFDPRTRKCFRLCSSN
jgi:hypothetical protein